MKRLPLLVLIACVVAGATIYHYRPWWVRRLELQQRNYLPSAVYDALENDPNLVLLALDPGERASETAEEKPFYGYAVLSKTVVSSAASRQALVRKLHEALYASDGVPNMCFNPRHGLQANYAGKSYDLLICFECGKMQLFQSGTGGDISHFTLKGDPGPFNELLPKGKTAGAAAD